MDVEKVKVLTECLGELRALEVCVFREINRANQAIQDEISPIAFLKRPVDVAKHVENHPLIEWGKDEQPCIKGTSVTVRDILYELALGETTVMKICEKMQLDINQVSGAVIFAAYVVSDSVY